MAHEQTPLISDAHDAFDDKSKEKWEEGRKKELLNFADANDVHKAASYVRESIFLAQSTSASGFADFYYYSILENDCRAAQLSRQVRKHPLFKLLVNICVLGIIIISFVEPPSWCRAYHDGDDDDTNGCELALKKSGEPLFYSDDSEKYIQDYYPNTGTNILSFHDSLVIETIFMLVILADFMSSLASYNFSLRKFFSMDVYSAPSEQINELKEKKLKISSTVRMIRCVSIILIIIGLRSVNRPFAIFLRMILFITYSEVTQEQLILSVKLVPPLLPVFTVLLFIYIFYGILGVAIFYNSAEGTDFFSNLIEAMWTLFTSMTSVIYPDVMMSAYNENRFSALYFVSFMTITFFFLLNVIMALVFSEYENSLSTKSNRIEDATKYCLSQAFHVLDKEQVGKISRTAMMSLFLILSDNFDEIRAISENNAEIMYALLDTKQSETLDFQQFSNLRVMLMLEFEGYSEMTWLEKRFPTFVSSSHYRHFSSIIQSKRFDKAIDIAIVANCIVIVVHSCPELVGQSVTAYNLLGGPWEIIEAIFVLIYVLEMTAKVVVLGWNRYISSLRNVLDGLITIVSLVTIIIIYSSKEFEYPGIVKAIVAMRIFRMLRLFAVMDSLQVLGRTFVAILPSAGKMLLLLLCVVYMFSATGMFFFGGLITRDPENPVSTLLEGTDFADNFYWANNFNDLLSGINVTFNLLVINNWNEMESGILAVSQTKQARWFFFAFYICGVIVVNNLVIALSIETFCNEREAKQQRDVDDSDKFDFVGHRLLFSADKMSKGKAGMSGSFVANINRQKQKTFREEKKILIDLFGSIKE